MTHDIILFYFQHLNKYPKNEKDASISTSKIHVSTQELTLGSPIVSQKEPMIEGIVVATQKPTIRVEEDIFVSTQEPRAGKVADMDKSKK